MYPTKEFLSDLWHFIRPHRGRFLLFSFFLMVAFFLDLIPALLLAGIIDFFKTYNGGTLDLFYFYLLSLFVIGVCAVFLRLTTKHALGNLTSRIQREAKIQSFQKLLDADLLWHDRENTGNKMEKISRGVASLGSFFDIYANQMLGATVALVGITAIFAFFELKYSLLSALFSGTYLFVEFFANRRVAQKTQELRIEQEKSSGKIYEFSSNVHTIKSLGMEKDLRSSVTVQEDQILLKQKERRKLETTKWISIQSLATLFFALFIFLVGNDIVLGLLTLGSIVIYIEYLRRLHSTLNIISNISEPLLDIKYSISRLMDIYKRVPQINNGTSTLKSWHTLAFHNISFAYKNEDVLRDFSLFVHKGEKIGIVGKSGSGKTTLFKLLLRLYLPQQGDIRFDNLFLKEIMRSSLVKHISFVPQETQLFNMTIRENIVIGDIFDPLRYQRALEMSHCLPLLEKLPEGDLTLIGENGFRLSGGERQRLGIARALYRESDILILDEATSQLDYATERHILSSLASLGKTLLFSAHRLEILKEMDTIIFLEGGTIKEQGTYHELLRKRGHLYRLLQEKKRGRTL